MAEGKITLRSVSQLKPRPKDYFVWDSGLKGFGLKVTPAGNRIFLVQGRVGRKAGPTRRVTIGRDGVWDAARARVEAERLLRMLSRGVDPIEDAKLKKQAKEAEKAKAEALEFEASAQKYLELHGKREWRVRTYASAESDFRRWIIPVLRGKPLSGVQRADIVEVLDQVPPSSQALSRSLFALMRGLFNWAVQRGAIKRSPMDKMKGPKPVKARDRVLDDREVVLIAARSQGLLPPFGPFVRMLMLTGQRRDEVAGMRWEELDRGAAMWNLPEGRVKNKTPHSVPLNRIALRALDQAAGSERWPTMGLVFTTTKQSPISGFSKMKLRLDAMIAEVNDGESLPDWRLHDLRRTFATNMQKLGVRFEVTEALLNHLAPRSGVTGVYQRYDWTAEKREAVDKWADHLGTLIEKAFAENDPNSSA